jgi:hypothetical protein
VEALFAISFILATQAFCALREHIEIMNTPFCSLLLLDYLEAGKMEREVVWIVRDEGVSEGEERLQAVQTLEIPGAMRLKEAVIDVIDGKIVVQREGNGVKLETYLRENGPLTEAQAGSMLLQIASALSQAETYVSPRQNLYPEDLSPSSVCIQGDCLLVDIFSPNSDEMAYWRVLRTLAVLAVYAGCGDKASYQEVSEDLAGHLATLHWRSSLKTMLLDMFYSKSFPSFSCLTLLLASDKQA